MIVDAHCHAWRTWPYEKYLPAGGPVVGLRGIRHEMMANSVGHALIVAANIENAAAANNEYVLRVARRYPEQFSACVDIDSRWSPNYHTPGSGRRLTAILRSGPVRAVSHYLGASNDGWFASRDGRELLDVIEDHGLPMSLHAPPGWIREVRRLAEAHPSTTFLIHHLGMVDEWQSRSLNDLAELTDAPNVYLKYSGPYYGATPSESYPFSSARDTRSKLLETFGSARVVWGSDYPVCLGRITYNQALQVCRDDLGALPKPEVSAILGGNLATLLGLREG